MKREGVYRIKRTTKKPVQTTEQVDNMLNAFKFGDVESDPIRAWEEEPEAEVPVVDPVIEAEFGTLASNKQILRECAEARAKIRKDITGSDDFDTARLKFKLSVIADDEAAAQKNIALLNKREVSIQGVRKVRIDVFEFFGGTRRIRLGGEI